MRRQIAATLWVVTASQASPPSAAAATAAGAPAPAQESAHATPGNGQTAGWSAEYGDKGLEIASPGGGWRFEPAVRVQLRFSDPFDDDPRTIAAIDMPPGSDLEIRTGPLQARHATGRRMADALLRNGARRPRPARPASHDRARAKRSACGFGQWKAEYNRERRDSSGSQQFVDRSIVNREFTVDRQQGAMLFGRLGRGGAADVSAWAGVFGGEGRGHFNDGGEPMYARRASSGIRTAASSSSRRATWGGVPSRRARSPSQPYATAAATRASRRMAAAISMASSPVRSISTRSSSGWSNRRSSGAAFPGSRNGTRRPWKIASPAQRHVFAGLYAQAGYFLHEAWSGWPEPLELALRYATVDPDVDHADDRRDELTFGANWYFNGHRHKLNAGRLTARGR